MANDYRAATGSFDEWVDTAPKPVADAIEQVCLEAGTYEADSAILKAAGEKIAALRQRLSETDRERGGLLGLDLSNGVDPLPTKCSECGRALVWVSATAVGCPSCMYQRIGCEERKRARTEAELAGARKRLAEAQFLPLGDNHHSASACPYCNPAYTRQVEAERALAKVLRHGSAWPLSSVLEWLSAAAEHLLREHGCDAHGYGGIGYAVCAAREIRVLLPASPSEPQTSKEK